MNIYKLAFQKKLRFSSRKGELAVEDLMDFSLDSLNLVGMRVQKTIRERADSMIPSKDKDIILDDLRLLILKDLIKDRVDGLMKRGIPRLAHTDEPEEIL